MRAKHAKGGKKVGSIITGKVHSNLGTVERTARTRTFVPAKPKVSTSFAEDGTRTIHYHNESPRTIKWGNKLYKVNRNVVG